MSIRLGTTISVELDLTYVITHDNFFGQESKTNLSFSLSSYPIVQNIEKSIEKSTDLFGAAHTSQHTVSIVTAQTCCYLQS